MSARRLAASLLALILAVFFAFVGWNKAFASLTDLAAYGAWTVHIPEAPGRAVGWSEMLCAIALLIPRMRFWAALILIINQIAAAGVHLSQGETGALPQNAMLIALLAVFAFAVRPQRHSLTPHRNAELI